MSEQVWKAALDAVVPHSFPLAMALASARVQVLQYDDARMLVLAFANPAVAMALRDLRDDYEPLVLAAFLYVGERFDGVAFVEVLP